MCAKNLLTSPHRNAILLMLNSRLVLPNRRKGGDAHESYAHGCHRYGSIANRDTRTQNTEARALRGLRCFCGR